VCATVRHVDGSDDAEREQSDLEGINYCLDILAILSGDDEDEAEALVGMVERPTGGHFARPLC
jgi:hypothetical protein